MKKLIIYTKKIYLVLIVMFFLISNISFGQTYESDDLMYQVFKEAISYGNVLEVGGKTSDDVGHEVLRGKTSIGAGESWKKVCLDPETDEILYVYDNNQTLMIGNENDCNIAGGIRKSNVLDVTYQAPLIARITKILLSITMVLAITMVIFTSVKLMINVLGGKDLKSSNIKKDITSIVIGVLLALLSVTIINLTRSIPNSSLGTSNDNQEVKLGCKFILNGQEKSMSRKEFKEYLCKNNKMMYEDENLYGREYKYIKARSNGEDHMDQRAIGADRCKVQEGGTRKWVIISDDNAGYYCISSYNGTLGLIN